jgi:carbon-monoxide dehydrogenase large subunit
MNPNPYIGRSVRREEDRPLLTGRGRYVSDIVLPGMLHLAFVRSPHASAAITRIDAARARALPGVEAVFTAADLPMKPIVADFTGENYAMTAWPPLARERVRFVGEPVAVVAARDRYVAEDAADLVEVEYALGPAVASVDAARHKGAPLVHDGVAGNVFFKRDHREGDVEGAFSRADVTVQVTLRHQRLCGLPLEGRGLVAAVQPDGRLHVWASTQTPHGLKAGVARFLSMPEDAVRVTVPDVGGGFGPKMHLYPEDVVVCAAARSLRRPVQWVEDRRENLSAMSQAREQRIDAVLAADKDGRILALGAVVYCDSGAYSLYPLTPVLEPMGTAQIMPGPYRVPAYAYRTHAIATNKCPAGAYRGVGMTAGVLVMERLMHRLAAATGLDPAEVRRRNFIGPNEFPYTAPTGLVYDSGRFEETLRAATTAFGYEQARREQAALRRGGRLVGIGLSTFVEYTGMGSKTFQRRGMVEVRGYDSATVSVDAAGRAEVGVSCPSQGQGLQTMYAQLAAGELGLDPADVEVTMLDTDAVPTGSGTFGSRAVVSGGGALVQAAAQVKVRAVEIAARLLEASVDDISQTGGMFSVKGSPERGVTWRDIARAAHGPGQPGLAASSTYDPPPAAFGNGAHLAMVEVDRETGQVAILRYVIAGDCGPLVNPMIVDGQTQGGLAQGIGETLMEEVVYDESGQHLTSTLMDYLIPTATDTPRVQIVHLETASPNTVHGFKGMGESATIGAPACLANAISDALDRAVDTLPISPTRVVELLQQT